MFSLSLFFFNDTATTEIYTLSLHDALPISGGRPLRNKRSRPMSDAKTFDCSLSIESFGVRSEEHTSELQSQSNLVCRLLLEKKKTTYERTIDFLEQTSYRYLERDKEAACDL